MQLYYVAGGDTGIDLSDSLPRVNRCSHCGRILNKQDVFDLKSAKFSSRWDLSESRDGFQVASEKFVRVCREGGFGNLEFHPIGKSFYVVECTRMVRFDVKRSHVRFENLCPACGQYESVVGPLPAPLLLDRNVGPRDFVWTDLHFSTLDEQGPLLIAGESAVSALRSAKLKRLYFLPEVHYELGGSSAESC
ncbi:MAG: hypothetical protein ABL309_00020 [Phycisphaerales bacterium]